MFAQGLYCACQAKEKRYLYKMVLTQKNTCTVWKHWLKVIVSTVRTMMDTNTTMSAKTGGLPVGPEEDMES